MANLQIVLAGRHVEAQYVEMMVPLYSYGCEKKVKKALSHIKGIYSVNVDYYQQKVTVWGICNKYDVLDRMRNKRKEARFWNPEDNLKIEDQSCQEPPPSVSSPSPPPPSLPKKEGKPSLLLSKSLSWKAWKRVFIRSNSF